MSSSCQSLMNVANGVPTKANFTPASNSKRAFKKEVFYVFCYLIMAHNTMVVGLHIEIPALEHCFCVESVNQRKPGEELQTRGALGFPDPGKRRKHSLRSKSIGKIFFFLKLRAGALPDHIRRRRMQILTKVVIT